MVPTPFSAAPSPHTSAVGAQHQNAGASEHGTGGERNIHWRDDTRRRITRPRLMHAAEGYRQYRTAGAPAPKNTKAAKEGSGLMGSRSRQRLDQRGGARGFRRT